MKRKNEGARICLQIWHLFVKIRRNLCNFLKVRERTHALCGRRMAIYGIEGCTGDVIHRGVTSHFTRMRRAYAQCSNPAESQKLSNFRQGDILYLTLMAPLQCAVLAAVVSKILPCYFFLSPYRVFLIEPLAFPRRVFYFRTNRGARVVQVSRSSNRDKGQSRILLFNYKYRGIFGHFHFSD